MIDLRPCAIRVEMASAWNCPSEGSRWRSAKGGCSNEGNKVALLSYGTRLAECLKAAERLAAMGLSTTVVDARFAKPLDERLVERLAREHEVFVTVEEGAVGGFGSFVLHHLARRGLLDKGLKVRTLALPDVFLDHDKPDLMYAQAGLDSDSIVACVESALSGERSSGVLRVRH